MKYLAVTTLAIAGVWLCFQFARLVPGAMQNGHFTQEFWLNAFFMVLGFLVTTAAISPMVALFLDWRSDVTWRAARLNARDRFAAALNLLLENYRLFLFEVRDGDKNSLAALFLAHVHQGLTDLFDTYESEQSALNAEMHSAASNIRQHLLPFKRGLESTNAMVTRMRSHRLFVGQSSLDNIRAVFEKPPLERTSILATNPYFAEFAEVYLDIRLDLQLGAGVMSVHRFASISPAILRSEWAHFVRAAPASRTPVPALVEDLKANDLTQAEVHAIYVRKHVREAYLADMLLNAGVVTPPKL